MIVSELHDALQKFAGSTPQRDDLTVLVVKRK
jgi:serine phosphatase RsbU (regulator of sigma subunit)